MNSTVLYVHYMLAHHCSLYCNLHHAHMQTMRPLQNSCTVCTWSPAIWKLAVVVRLLPSVQCFKYALTGLPSSYSDPGPKRLRTAYQEPYQEPRATRYPAHAATAAGYPQRPGEQKCSFYMRTAKCSYGPGCKFDHPAWVPPEGIPGWKEVRIGSA